MLDLAKYDQLDSQHDLVVIQSNMTSGPVTLFLTDPVNTFKKPGSVSAEIRLPFLTTVTPLPPRNLVIWLHFKRLQKRSDTTFNVAIQNVALIGDR